MASFLKLSFLLLLVATSCTIEKRLYQRGYHIEWRKRAISKDIQTTQYDSDAIPASTSNSPEFIKSVSSEVRLPAQCRDSVVENSSTDTNHEAHSSFPKTVVHPNHLQSAQAHEHRSTAKSYNQTSGPGPALVTIMLFAALLFLIYKILDIAFSSGAVFLTALPYVIVAVLIIAILVAVFIHEDWV